MMQNKSAYSPKTYPRDTPDEQKQCMLMDKNKGETILLVMGQRPLFQNKLY